MADKVKTVNDKKAAELTAKRKAEQKKFRENPDKLAAEIAKTIREDQHAGEDPAFIENGGNMHWYQQAWGVTQAKPENLKEVRLKNQRGWHDVEATFFEITCPTTGCVAGWADVLAGYPLLARSIQHQTVDELIAYYNNGAEFRDGVEIIGADYCLVDGTNQAISTVAAQLLNLDDYQEEWLFHAENDIKRVLWALDQIAEGNYHWHPDNYDA